MPFVTNNGTWYADTLAALYENSGCIGFHLCGAYQRNKARRRGLLDEMEDPDQENARLITAATNGSSSRWMNGFKAVCNTAAGWLAWDTPSSIPPRKCPTKNSVVNVSA